VPPIAITSMRAFSLTVMTVAAFCARQATGFRAGASTLASSRRSVSQVVMAERTPLIAGNWKMNTQLNDAVALATAVKEASAGAKANVAVIPPFPFLAAVSQALEGSNVALGAQDCWTEDQGAFTGAVSTPMLQSVGCSHVLTGHSERRSIFGESDALINEKTKKVLSAGLTAILCIGELKEEREAGTTNTIVADQLKANLAGVSEADLSKVVIAYEPVWAIGTGLTATPEQAQDTHAFIRSWFVDNYSQAAADSMVIQYGGSVSPETVDELMACPDIDGALVGGASLLADKFARIINFE